MKSHSLWFLAALAVLCTFTGAFSQIELYGPLEGVLPAATYLVTDYIFIQAQDSLIIEPGARFKFLGYYPFIIYGYLRATGTPADSIIFEPAGLDSIASIIFRQGASRSSLLSYCRFSGFTGSAINLYYGGITISHCTITENRAQWGGGLYLSYDSTLISDCLISKNLCRKNGGGIYCSHASPTVVNCVITDNVCNLLSGDSGHGGAGLCANHSSSPIITGCTITSNHSGEFGGGLCFSDNSFASMSHCLIAGNMADSSGGGAAILAGGFNPSAPVITNCTFGDNHADSLGGGIFIETSYPTLSNTIIANSWGEGGVYFLNSPNSTLRYGDLYNPLTDNFGGDVPGHLGQLTGVNANGDSCDDYANLPLNPLLINPWLWNYHLQPASPCIDAGDPALPLDPDNTIADIGAYYFAQDAAIVEPEVRRLPDDFLLVRVYPNPLNPRAVIRYELHAPSLVRLIVWDTQGRLVETLEDVWQSAGVHEVTFDGSNLVSGIYLYRLTTGSEVSTGKMVLMK